MSRSRAAMTYSSSLRLFGLPLLDIRIGGGPGMSRCVARGWIAIGDVALGVVFAAGGLAAGGVAVGGLSAGVLPLGGLALGLVSVGGGAFGVWAVGGAAFGLVAALGGLAVATSYARGGLAVARHANDAAALAFFSSNEFLRRVQPLLPYSRWLLLLVLLPLLFARRRPDRWSGSPPEDRQP